MDWNAVGQAALTATVQIAVPIAATLVIGLLVQALRRMGLAISAEQQARWEKLAQDAIARQEEKDAQLRKETGGQNKLTASAKLAAAAHDVLTATKSKDIERAVSVIEAQLLAKGAGAAASLVQRAQQRFFAQLPGGPGA